MSIDVHLLFGPPHDPGCQAWVLDLPGFATWAPTEKEVLVRVPERVTEHRAWLREIGLEPPAVAGTPRVVERVRGDEPSFTADLLEASDEDIARTRVLLERARAELLAAAGGLPEGALDWEPPYASFPPWATWRSVLQILDHVARCEVSYYLASVGWDPGFALEADTPVEEALERSREATLAFLGDLEVSDDRVRRHRDRGEDWTARKVLRRLVWHELLHARSIRRIARDFERLWGRS